MTTRYPGGLIRKTPPTITPPVGGEGGSAPGVWTLEQASYYTKQGTWPLPVLPRYLYGAGYNVGGAVGDGTQINRSSPVQVGSDTNWSKISARQGNFATSIKSDGTLWSWGINSAGQLGQNDRVARSSPTQIGALTTWLEVSTGYSFVLATKNDGTLWSWGTNGSGQLGQNISFTTYRSSPVQVGALTTWSKVGAGYFHSFAIKTDGTLWAWGNNNNGALGLNDIVDKSSPVQVGSLTTWLSVSSGYVFSGAIKTDGTLWAWGYNLFGQLGQNNKIYRSSPVQVGSLTNWSKLSLAYYNTAAIKTDGTLWLWGQSNYGQLGFNNDVATSSPVQLGSSTWSVVNSSGSFTSAIKTDGTLWTWGQGTFGQLAINTNTSRSSPVQVGSKTTWTQVSNGSSIFISIATS
jgi:alpha-tubulin suppressor-like RCC1 family protein